MSKDYSLSLRGEAFNSLCADFDTTLRDVLAGMIETEQNTGEINIKVKITLTDDSAPDYTVAGGHQTREVTKPKFDHTVAYVIHDCVVSRVAHRLEELCGEIELCQSILKNAPDLPAEYRRANKEQVRQRLELARWNLDDLLEDIEDGIVARELKRIYNEYCGGGDDGEV